MASTKQNNWWNCCIRFHKRGKFPSYYAQLPIEKKCLNLRQICTACDYSLCPLVLSAPNWYHLSFLFPCPLLTTKRQDHSAFWLVFRAIAYLFVFLEPFYKWIMTQFLDLPNFLFILWVEVAAGVDLLECTQVVFVTHQDDYLTNKYSTLRAKIT